MMREQGTYSTDAINIKTYPLSENDNIVVMFSKDKGLIKGVAKGVKKPKSKLGARMQMLVCNKLMFNEGKSLDVIKEAQAINPFNKLRYDLEKLTYAIYVAEIVGYFCRENTESDPEINEKVYKFLYYTLENIQNAKSEAETILSVIKFQLKFMRELGLGIEIGHCLNCGCKIEEESYFSFSNGGVICKDCQGITTHNLRIHIKIKEFLNALIETEINQASEYDKLINEKVALSCFNLLKKYIDTQAGRECKTLKVLEMTKVS